MIIHLLLFVWLLIILFVIMADFATVDSIIFEVIAHFYAILLTIIIVTIAHFHLAILTFFPLLHVEDALILDCPRYWPKVIIIDFQFDYNCRLHLNPSFLLRLELLTPSTN